LDLNHDALGAGAQGVIKTGIKRAVPRDGTTNANHGDDQGSCTKNEDRDLAACARQK
jgi:hypothetical protein